MGPIGGLVKFWCKGLCCVTCKQFWLELFRLHFTPSLLPQSPFSLHTPSLFAFFLCRHAKKKFSYPTQLSGPRDEGKREIEANWLIGTVWLVKGWAVHGDSPYQKHCFLEQSRSCRHRCTHKCTTSSTRLQALGVHNKTNEG
jgi:hypothetical protein